MGLSGIRKLSLALLIVSMLTFGASSSKADPTKEFLMSSTYGVLAGSLVGAATLAFRDNPGDHLKSIAVGASLGLYAGILLGAYVAYFVPSEGEAQQQVVPDEDIYEAAPQEEDVEDSEEGPETDPEARVLPVISPIVANGTVEGGYIGLNVAFF